MAIEPLPAAVTIGDSVLFQELDNEVVLLDLSSQNYYSLNDVGAKMWKCLIETGSPSLTLARLSEQYDVDPATLSFDLSELVTRLLSAGLLKAPLK